MSVRKKQRLLSLLDAGLLLVMCGLLYYGASWQIFKTYTDAAKYQCYGLDFWHGESALTALPEVQCQSITHPQPQDLPALSQKALVSRMQQLGLPGGIVEFVAGQSSTLPWHALPSEYPALTLLPFSLGLVAPVAWYQVAFALWMVLVAAVMYLVLLRWRSRSAAIACACYLVLGGWATVAGRFDIIPSLLTLGALICSVKKHWNWAFVLLALATMLKFYPALLLLPFLLAQQLTIQGKVLVWRRWSPLLCFMAVCLLLVVISLALNVTGTLAPLSYFGNRPVQIESLTASVLWMISLLGGGALTYDFSFGSFNLFSPLSSSVALLATLLMLAGLLYTFWMQWRGKIDLVTTCLLTLLIVMITSKVFSPQYLIWVVPLAAYRGESKPWWLLPWGLLGLLTTWVYPYIYFMTAALHVAVQAVPLFFPVAGLRNLLLLGLILSLLISSARKGSPGVANTSALPFSSRLRRQKERKGVVGDTPNPGRVPLHPFCPPSAV